MYSVVMAVYNGEKFVRAAIESIFSQSLLPTEVIIVNDFSNDKTGELLCSFGEKISILECKAKNMSAALNLGIKRSTSEFLAFLDHDDLWMRNKQLEQIMALRDSSWDCVSGGVSNFNSKGERTYFGPARVFGATTFTRSVLERVGQLDESIKHHSIFNWWSRARILGVNNLLIDREHLLRRIHDSNSGITQKPEARRAMVREVRTHLRRNP